MELALLKSVAVEGIEPARQFLLNHSSEEPSSFLHEALLAVCQLTGERFPEFDAWLAAERESRSRRMDDGEDEDDRESETLAATIVRKNPIVGRNDPCPCGSGKKFKKCCYGKERATPFA